MGERTKSSKREQGGNESSCSTGGGSGGGRSGAWLLVCSVHAGGSSFGCSPVVDGDVVGKREPVSVFGERLERKSVSFSGGGGRAGARSFLMNRTDAEPGAGTGNGDTRVGVVGIWSRPTHRSRPYLSHLS